MRNGCRNVFIVCVVKGRWVGMSGGFDLMGCSLFDVEYCVMVFWLGLVRLDVFVCGMELLCGWWVLI